MSHQTTSVVIRRAEELLRGSTRRQFLRAMGVGGTALLLPSVFTACDDDDPVGPGEGDAVVLDLRTDVGILNYAYALEQLEAAYYTAVVAGFGTSGITAPSERSMLTEIRNHEIIHRDFLAAALGTAALPALAVDFGTALASRQSVLETARAFEDLGVAAYNGAGQYLARPENLLVAGKIVSVEARHAAAIRDVLDTTGRAFAGNDVVDGQGLDRAWTPAQVLAAADPFVVTPISIGNAPTA